MDRILESLEDGLEMPDPRLQCVDPLRGRSRGIVSRRTWCRLANRLRFRRLLLYGLAAT